MALFDTAPEPKPKTPTAPQMRFLHALRDNVLELKTFPTHSAWLKKPNGDLILFNFHPVVAANVVLRDWAEMKAFDGSGAVYTLSTEGGAVLKELCGHSHVLEDSAEVLAGTLVCKKCARALRCRSKQPTSHPANRWHFRYGPICQNCWDFLYYKTP